MNFRFSDLEEFVFGPKKVVCTTGFVKPVHIVMMSAVNNYTPRRTSFKNSTASGYADSMRYSNPLDIDTIDGANHSKAIKLRDQFDDDKQVEKIMNIFHSNGYLDNDTNDVLSIILAEIFQNFYAHADYDKPPICCVQDWKTSDYIEIAIADKGCGIAKSLEKVLEEYPEDTNPCRIACENGVSGSLNKESKIGTKHSGFGLFFTKRFIEKNQGALYLFSDDECYIKSPMHELDKELPYRWMGTVVRLIINKNVCIEPVDFWKTISKEQEGEAYDEFF